MGAAVAFVIADTLPSTLTGNRIQPMVLLKWRTVVASNLYFHLEALDEQHFNEGAMIMGRDQGMPEYEVPIRVQRVDTHLLHLVEY